MIKSFIFCTFPLILLSGQTKGIRWARRAALLEEMGNAYYDILTANVMTTPSRPVPK
jgi:hypothetical protein